MKRSFKTYHTNISFIDLLFNTILGFAVFFTICLILMSLTKEEEPSVRMKAEFMVVLSWDSNEDVRADDIDLWIEDPTGQIMFFRNKDTGFMHLDRDDLGDTNDITIAADGRRVYCPTNQEVGTIRGCLAGEWTVNVHMYSKKIKDAANVEVRVDKLNPSVSLIAHEKFVMSKQSEEVTVIRFTMSEDGKVQSTDKILKEIVKKRLTNYHTRSQEGEVYGGER